VTVAIGSGRRTVEVSRPGKPLFPEGITKADLARYYEAVADVMLPHIAGRPLNMERFPDGIEAERIFQQRDRWTLRTVLDRLERDGDARADIRSAASALGTARRRLDEARRGLSP
jgi:DNA primase